ncbi:MAG: hypothetical protein IPG25_05230 [Proteobacteria bacterium]|mgnify:FL=1|nr:hypothetical protein [Pseudomonadota bacterium]
MTNPLHIRTTATTLCALLVLLIASVSASADDSKTRTVPASKFKIVEQALEASTRQVILPGSETGILVVTACVGCTPVSLTAGSATQWQVGQDTVSLAVFRQHLQRQPRAQLGVFFNRERSELLRVVATAR